MNRKPSKALRHSLTEQVGAEIMRFQEASNAVDTAAATVLSVERNDLPCLTALMVGGPGSVSDLARRLVCGTQAVRDTIARLALAGYVRRCAAATAREYELTEHARHWIAEIWEPLRAYGPRVLAACTVRDLAMIKDVLRAASDVQLSHASALHRLQELPRSERPGIAKGGLSPAALRRVQLLVDAHLDGPLPLTALARRAGLSPSHFARAFRATTAMTPRAFVEARRIARARLLVIESDVPLAEIAAQTGFSSQSRFTTAFRRLEGITPAVLRRNRSQLSRS